MVPIAEGWLDLYRPANRSAVLDIVGRGGGLPEPAGDPAAVALAIARTLPAMIQDAEDAGLTIVADHLTRALEAAEGRSEDPLESAIDEP